MTLFPMFIACVVLVTTTSREYKMARKCVHVCACSVEEYNEHFSAGIIFSPGNTQETL